MGWDIDVRENSYLPNRMLLYAGGLNFIIHVPLEKKKIIRYR